MSKFSEKKDKQLKEDASTYLVQRWEPSARHKPLIMVKGEGVYMWDVAGKKYLDFISQLYNVHIGMGNRVPIEAAKKQLDDLAYASPSYYSEPQIKLAKKLAQITPGDLCQTFFGNSGTEANEVAIKLAQLYREAPKIVSFWDAYHGSTYAMVSVGGSARNRQAKGLSIFEEFKHIASPYCYRCPYKKTYPECGLFCAEFLKYTIEKEGENTVAAFMAEPICSWAGQVVPPDGYWKRIREICDEKGILMIFDEVMTGFRIAPGGAPERFGVTPDLTTLGKVIGGGLPVAAYGGRADLMEQVAPAGPVYQAGTLSGNPLAMAAGYTTISMLTRDLHDRIAGRTAVLVQGLREIAARRGVPFTADHAGSMWGFFFRAEPVRNFADARTADTALFTRFYHEALARGVYLAPSPFEAAFMSAAHGDDDVAQALERLDAALGAARG